MKPTYSIFAVAALLIVAACESNPKSLPPGQYSHSETNTNARGTTTTRQTDTNVYYDKNGNKRAVQETETTKDPDGLFNKKTTTTTKTY